MSELHVELVSIIIPTYNAAGFIRETLESAIAQTHQDTEIIVVDDCSTDHTLQIVMDYAKMHKKIRVYQLEKNSGPAVTRNKGLQYAKGRHVAFLDSDDLWVEDKLERQLALMNEKNAAISYTAIEYIDEDGHLIKDKRNVPEVVDYHFLLKNTVIACSSVVIDRKLTGYFNMPLLRRGQDYATWLQLMRNGTKAYGINDVLVKYRIVSGSVSSNKFKSLKKVWNIYTKYEMINPVKAAYYCFCFACNAFKKHYI